MKNPQLYQSKVILNNYSGFIEECYKTQQKFEDIFKLKDSTWNFSKYNIFNLTSTNILFYDLYKELNYHIRSFIGDDRPLWIQSWLNFHNYNQILKKHTHTFPYHGYISIDPKKTTTVFDHFEIPNTSGQIYIGPGGNDYYHYVRTDEPFKGNRITIGFDILDKPNEYFTNLGIIPLI